MAGGMHESYGRQCAAPMPPDDVDLAKLMAQANDSNRATPSVTAMVAAQQITSNPFSGKEAAFESQTVREEYEALCRDHNALVEFGNKYAEFDPLGKLAYLGEVDKIQERWDIFFTRFSLMGALDKTYVKQCSEFLASMGMDETQYRELLRQTHDLMRQDAEAERNR